MEDKIKECYLRWFQQIMKNSTVTKKLCYDCKDAREEGEPVDFEH